MIDLAELFVGLILLGFGVWFYWPLAIGGYVGGVGLLLVAISSYDLLTE